MNRKLTPEEIEICKDAARRYHAAQQKMVKERERFQHLLGVNTQALASFGGVASPGAKMLALQKRLAELALRQMAVYPLDAKIYESSPEALSPGYEARTLELNWLTLQLDYIALAALSTLVKGSLAALAQPEDEAAPPTGPEAWQAEAALLATDGARREQWVKYQGAFETFELAMREVEALRAGFEPATQDLAARDQWRECKLPTLKGHAYRAHGVLRMLPTGEEILGAVRDGLMAELVILKAAAATPKAGLKPSTNRLLNRSQPLQPRPGVGTNRLDAPKFKPPGAR